MNIPLDHLYHYIENVVNRVTGSNILIYGFYPHGSKKLEDFGNFKKMDFDWLPMITTPVAVMHDQEPLNYDLYSFEDFKKIFKNRSLGGLPVTSVPGLSERLAGLHFRSLFDTPTNCWDYALLFHSEQRSKELDKFENNHYVGVYWWSHAIIARDWFRYAQYDQQLSVDVNNLKQDFIVFNRAWSGTREYRLKFLELLIDKKLLKNSTVKFNPVDEDQHYLAHTFKNTDFKLSCCNLESFFSTNTHQATASADYNAKEYSGHAVEIVLETLFDDCRLHLTEKSLRPIACGRPFILAATAGSLKYLQHYGFKTFAPYINEDYDSIMDPLSRLTAIVNEMKRISNLSIEEKRKLWQQLYNIADYNKKLFFSQEWAENIVTELSNNIATAFSTIKQHRTGLHRQNLHEFIRCNGYGHILDNHQVRTQIEVNQLEQWLKECNNKY